MSSERAAFLAAIVAHPDEHTPRLVYADWLDEFAESLSGDERNAVAAQAEVLRLSVGRSSALDGLLETDEMNARANALENRHEKVWLVDVPKYARTWVRIAQGLPLRLEITARLLLKHGKRLRRDVPYTSLRLRNAADCLEDVVNQGLLAGLHDLDISFNNFRDGELIHLFRSPDLASVRDLDLAHISFGDAAADALVTSKPLANLHQLNVWWCNACVGQALAKPTTTLSELKRLQIGNSGLDIPILTALVNSPLAKGLEDLELSYNQLGQDLGEVLAHAPPLAQLRRLSMWSCGLRDGGLTALAASPHLRKLEYLGLNSNAVKARGVGALAQSPVAASIRALSLESNGFHDDAVVALSTKPAFRNLERLELGGVVIDPNHVQRLGLEALLQSPLAVQLRDLDLYGSEELGPQGAVAIANSSALSRLERLDLGKCNLQSEGGVAIARASHLANLKYLRLSGNRLGSRGVEAIASAPWLSTLRDLHLFDNQCGAAAELLLANPHIDRLETLTLNGNRVKPEIREKFTARLGTRVRF